MIDRALVRRLIEDALDGDQTPDELCAAHPESAAAIRRQWQEMERVASQLEAVFPTPRPSETPRNGAFDTGSPLPSIAGYEVQSQLGRGGMGVVYKARHLKLNRIVAVKMLLAGEFASPAEIERFRKESQAMARLRHPNIVQVYDVGGCDGRPYFTMEYIEGGTLAEKLGGSPLPGREAAELVATLADGVQAAHDACTVHRDLKPSNILLGADGTPKISDCGVARHLDAECRLTQAEGRVGTPSYMAPEQAKGGLNASCPAVDIYALGAILYETLTGRPPFRASSSSETERQVINDDPAPPSRLNRSIPRDLETICLKCLHKEPSRRYARASALATDLRRFLRGETIAARRSGLLERIRKWTRRQPALASALFASAVVAVALAGVAWSWTAERSAVVHAVEEDLVHAERAERRSDWMTADAAIARAGARLGEHGSTELRRRVAQTERNLKLVARLDAIRLNRAMGGNRFNLERSAEEYRKELHAIGIDASNASPTIVAERVASSPIRRAIIAALDDWAACTADNIERVKILNIATLADPDPAWRDRVRNPANWKDSKALGHLAKSAPIDSPSVPLFLLLTTLLDDAGNDAASFLRRVQRAHPQDFWVNFTLAELLDARQDPDAIGFYRAALSLRPDATACSVNLGISLANQGRRAEAMDYYRQALVLAPDSAIGHYNLAVALHAEKDYGEALKHSEEADRLEPQNGRVLALLGDLYMRQGRIDQAREACRRAIQLLNESDPARTAAQGTLHHIEGKAPDPVVAGLQKARALAGKRKWREAAAAYADLFKAARTDDSETWFEYGAVQLLADDTEGYLKTCDVMKERCGKSPRMRSYHVARAYTLGDVSAENLKTAMTLSADELRRHGSEFWSLTQQGALLVRAGRCNEAAPLLEQSLTADSAPGRAVLNWLWLALAHRELGHIEESKRWIAKAAAWTDVLAASEKRGVAMPGFHFHNYLEASILSREIAPTQE